MALFVVAIAGSFAALALFGINGPPRGPRSEVVPISKILSVPAFLSMIAGGICITFAGVSLIHWAVDFAVNYKDFSLREASVGLAVITLLSLLLGVLCGGGSGRRCLRRLLLGGMAGLVARTPFRS